MHFSFDFFMEIFLEDNVTEEQPNLGPCCSQYQLHNKINSKQGSRKMVHEKIKRVKLCELHKRNLNFNFAKTNMYALNQIRWQLNANPYGIN